MQMKMLIMMPALNQLMTIIGHCQYGTYPRPFVEIGFQSNSFLVREFRFFLDLLQLQFSNYDSDIF